MREERSYPSAEENVHSLHAMLAAAAVIVDTTPSVDGRRDNRLAWVDGDVAVESETSVDTRVAVKEVPVADDVVETSTTVTLGWVIHVVESSADEQADRPVVHSEDHCCLVPASLHGDAEGDSTACEQDLRLWWVCSR